MSVFCFRCQGHARCARMAGGARSLMLMPSRRRHPATARDHAALSVRQPKRTVAPKAQSPRKSIASSASRSPYGSTCCQVAGSSIAWGRRLSRNASKQGGYAMTEITNDTEVFDAMRFDIVSGDMVWTGREGTREAIRREKLAVDQLSWKSCPHQWLDERGFVDRELSRKHPQPWPSTL